MNRKTTLAGLGLAAVTVGALGVGTAFASGHAPTAKISHSTPAAETPSAADGDNVQQGDQTGPDTAATDIATAGDTADTSATRSVGTTSTSAANPGAVDVATAGDKADSPTAADKPSTESSSETADQSDGPGGYADQNSNADTQQEGEH
jgi:hypothetical protein